VRRPSHLARGPQVASRAAPKSPRARPPSHLARGAPYAPASLQSTLLFRTVPLRSRPRRPEKPPIAGIERSKVRAVRREHGLSPTSLCCSGRGAEPGTRLDQLRSTKTPASVQRRPGKTLPTRYPGEATRSRGQSLATRAGRGHGKTWLVLKLSVLAVGKQVSQAPTYEGA
jgi:hypothetical protein